ncbi:hypothetical protein F8388_002528 [Cannabis sativa]|uniref:ATP synthase protein MI25 n=1 Tax=Cannabis sativa TaxID=3483 RepID=A0A7J6DPQ2_CANSA|nr:hypothetical protein F8388_002528 [Cannabis sativa]
MMGQLFALLVLTVAAAESAIGLAIFVITFRVRGTIDVEFINSIQGSGPFSARKMLFAAILSICAFSSKKISIYNEEMIVACCFIGFIIFSRKSLGDTFKVTLDGRIQAIQEELQQFLNPNKVVLLESNEQQRLLRICLRICGTVVESLTPLLPVKVLFLVIELLEHVREHCEKGKVRLSVHFLEMP